MYPSFAEVCTPNLVLPMHLSANSGVYLNIQHFFRGIIYLVQSSITTKEHRNKNRKPLHRFF